MSPARRTLLCAFCAAFAMNASATVGEKVDAAASAASGVARTVHKAVVRGAKAAASGVERRARAVAEVAGKGARKLEASEAGASAPAR